MTASPSASSPTPTLLPPVAVLVLDAAGKVVAANSSAHTLWGATPGQLEGEAFVSLFEFEIVSQDPDWLASQWAAVLAAAADDSTFLSAKNHDGAVHPVQVRLEKAPGLADRLLATVQPVVTSQATAPPDNATSSLAAHPGIGFFSLTAAEDRATFSEGWKQMLGYVSAELPEKPETWEKLLHPDDSAAAPFLKSKHAKTGRRPFDVEFRLRHRLGHYVWVHCLGLQTIGDDGALVSVTGLQMEITERKEAEEAGIASAARLEALSDQGDFGVFELDFSARHFWFSPAWKRLLGFDETDALDQAAAFLSVLPPAEAELGLEKWILQLSPAQASFVAPVQLKRKDGTPISLMLGAHYTQNRKQHLANITGFLCPTPSTLVEIGGIDLPRGLTADAFAALAEAVILTDLNGSLLALNSTAERILHTTAAVAIGRPLHEIFKLVYREGTQTVEDPCELALAAGAPLPLCSDHALAIGDGPPLPVVWSARVSYGEGNRTRGVVFVFRDPNEMTLTPEELIKANRFETLAMLAGGIAHDFNNLLSVILGSVSIAKDNHDYSALDDAEQSCLTAKGLTKQLLTFVKSGASARVVMPVSAILQDSAKIAAAGNNTQVTVDVADDVWPVQVDRSQILQVFQNLIVNALQAMPEDNPAARVQLRAVNANLAAGQHQGVEAGEYVEIEIRDNGAGIKPEHLAKIFDPFFTTKKHGTGLGLATVRSIILKHNGEIAVNSTVGTGTVFTVFLPRADQPVEAQARSAPSLRFGTGRVLFMDDDPKICALTANMLQSLDYKFDIARNGEEAINFYKRYLNIGRPYDAVIMDLTVIGGMGGEDCFNALRELDPDVRAIVASGYDVEGMASGFLDRGFCGYLAKPFRVTDLAKVIKTVLG